MTKRRPFNMSPAISALAVTALLCSPVAAMPASANNNPAPLPAPEDLLTAMPEVMTQAMPAVRQPERIIVKFKEAHAGDAVERGKAYRRAAVTAGVTVKEVRTTGAGAAVVQASKDLTAEKTDQLAAALEAQPGVEYAEADTFLRPAATPDDEYYSYQWPLHEEPGGMRVPGAWDQSTGTGTTVAVVDTGILPHHDLDPNLVSGYDFVTDPAVAVDGNGRDPDNTDAGDSCNGSDASWHGTHVAGTIGAYTGTGTGNTGEPVANAGVVGVAHGSRIQPIRALGACGGWLSDIADAVVWAVGGSVAGVPANPTPASVVNLSLGGPSDSCGTTLQNAMDFAASRSAVVVVAAGNSNAPVSGSTPANCDKVITVGATGREGARSGYSNFGPAVDVSAPGGDFKSGVYSGVLSTYNDGQYVPGEPVYGFLQGTSMAAPHVAGAAALMQSAAPALTPAQIEARLKETARPLPGTCDTGGCGAGLVDAAAAVKAVAPAAADFTSAPAPSIGSATVGTAVQARPFTENWSPAPESFTYQWLRNDAPIPGATLASYTPVDADRDTRLAFSVTAAKANYKTTTVTSEHRTVADRLSTPAPVIKGTAQVGATLTAEGADSWTPGPVTASYQWFRGDTQIEGATSATYTPAAVDLGRNLRVRASGEGPDLPRTEVFSEQTAAVIEGAITPGTPEISGSAVIGQTLQASPGTWPQDAALAYQWLRAGTGITGATGSAYTPTPDDEGKTVTVRVTGTKDGYTAASRESAPTAAVSPGVVEAPAPVVSGEAKVGHTLTATAGDWDPETAISYQWLRSGTPITGATLDSYILDGEDLDKTISVQVTGSRPGYMTATNTSAPTAAVAPGTLEAPVPALSGYPKVGYTLSAAAGSWPEGTVLGYQWYRSGETIAGATGSRYTLAAAEMDKAVTVEVTGSKAGYTTAARVSAQTAAVLPGYLQAPVPVVSGYPKVGYTLKAAAGTWPSGTTLSYQWYRSGAAIIGATGSGYSLGANDHGKTMQVKVTGSKAGYTTAGKVSLRTEAVLPGMLTAPVPVVSGYPKVGYTLKAAAGTWTAGTTLRYQWYRSGAAIIGATGSGYTLGANDHGKTMQVKVTGSKAGYTTAGKVSLRTEPVLPGMLTAPVPVVSGDPRVGYVLTAEAGTWTPGTTLEYQWYRSGAAIFGATGSAHELVPSDQGKTMTVRVTGSRAGYTTAGRLSQETAPVLAGSPASPEPAAGG